MDLLKKGLTSFDLKVIGIVLMVVDHLHEMFYFVGVPLWFSMLGRVVAPIFLFLSAEGFHYTHNRKRYMLNLLIGYWICNIAFYGISALLPNPQVQLINSIFGTLFLGLCFMWILEGYFGQQKYPGKATLGLVGFGILSAVPLVLMGIPGIPRVLVRGILMFVPSPLTVEGGFVFIGLAGVFYLFREKRWIQYVAILLIGLLMFMTDPDGIQWMMVFSLIPIALYNGREGKKEKWFFYIFYPTHIVALYIISTVFFQ